MQKKYLITQIFLLYAKHILKCISAAITRICVVRYVRFYTRWHRRENDQFSTLRCTKTGSTQPKLSAACFVVQSCLADADFVVFSDYCLIGTRHTATRFIFFNFTLFPKSAFREFPEVRAGAEEKRKHKD